MEETALVLDTHADIQELIKFGMSEPLAETVVRQRVRLIEYNFATKADIAATNANIEKLRLATQADIEKLRQETKADIAAVKADIEKLRLETKTDIAATNANIEKLRQETRADIATTNANIALSKNDMIKWFIGVNLGVAALIVAAIKLL